MGDSIKTETVVPSPVALDGTLVARATRLLIAYLISLVLLISAIVAGYLVLREEMETQRALSEANTHINVIHRTINESVSLLSDFRETARAVQPGNRLATVIGQRIIRAAEELDTHAGQLTETMLRLEGKAHWDDIKWITRTLADDQKTILGRYVRQMRQLVLRREELGEEKLRPQIPAEAAGARYGALSNDFKEASEQLSVIIERHSIRVEEVHRQLTYLILGMFFLVSLLIVFPLWNRLIREHRRHELAHQKLHHLAYTDQETGLYNLVGYEQYILNDALPSDTIHTHHLLLLRIQNLDEIYNLIDSQQIREVHRLICTRLNASLLAELEWARSGESEYATVISQKTFNDAAKWVEPFFSELSSPVSVSGVLVRPVISIATSQLEKVEDKDGGLLREHHANARMVLPNFDRTVLRVPTYDISLTHELAEQNELITAITHGIENREFVPYYQLKFDALSGRPCSAEVLCRWPGKNGGVIGPDKFIPAAEKSGQIVPMTYQLLEQIVGDVRVWSARGLNVGPVAINISSDVLHHKDFTSQITGAREALLAMQSDLEIEITENIFIESNMGPTRQVLQQISERGIRIAIDDFGTGYASLQTLINLPFDILKIDKSFVVRMSQTRSGNEVVSAMISLCTKLEKRSVIEGVEYEWQWHQLAGLGADELQGFFFHKPACATDVGTSLEGYRSCQEASSHHLPQRSA